MPIKVTGKAGKTNATNKVREEIEKRWNSSPNKRIIAPEWLTDSQKKIFDFYKVECKNAGVLSNADLESLTQASVIIDRIQTIDKSINEDSSLILDRKIQAIRSLLFQQYLKICAELCLSPVARAKMGTLVVANLQDKGDPLMDALKGKRLENES